MDKSEIIEEILKGKKNSEIAESLGVSLSTIKRNLKRFDIVKRDIIKDKVIELNLLNIDNENISKQLNISTYTVKSILKDKGINKFQSRQKDLTEFQMNALIGTLLGDSNLRTYNNKTANGTCNHVEKNFDYVIYKKSIFEGLVTDNIYSVQPKMANANLQYGFRFISSPQLFEVYKNVYTPKRRINQWVLDRYEAVSLALHYQDDGSKCHNTYKISMMGFPEEDIKLFSEFLLNRFEIKSSVHKSGDLYIKRSSSDLFKSIVKPFMVDSMNYKLY